jgi:hypothetical protein
MLSTLLGEGMAETKREYLLRRLQEVGNPSDYIEPHEVKTSTEVDGLSDDDLAEYVEYIINMSFC